ncbi:MAG: hypothetical protein FWD52_07915 [Candidatus Bathyarchaeota archaeon]|nr:hypothetical protein [Candidatus Termiticorpusculum sp.]
MVTQFHDPRKWSLLGSSLLVVTLISFLFVGIFVNGLGGSSLVDAVYVKTEDELRNAINNAPTGKPITIALDNDITLTKTTDDHNSNYHPVNIIIPADKDITLTSNKPNGYYKLTGAVNGTILFVASNGILRIDGITVTHTRNTVGSGVSVYRFAEFYLYNGIIYGNKANIAGGVFNAGIFVMSGGTISGNAATDSGGGVYNIGTFAMSGGEISGNTAASNGGGIWDYMGVFTMSGGTILGNTATGGSGGGVHLWGGVHLGYSEFTMSGGEISGNKAAKWGGGVHSGANFTMSNGKISGNIATLGGGVYNAYVFTMSGGEISGNTAATGGGVYNIRNFGDDDLAGTFNRLGGKISGNIASSGNNVYPTGSLRVVVVIVSVVSVVVTICIVLFVLRNSSEKRLDQTEKR